MPPLSLLSSQREPPSRLREGPSSPPHHGQFSSMELSVPLHPSESQFCPQWPPRYPQNTHQQGHCCPTTVGIIKSCTAAAHGGSVGRYNIHKSIKRTTYLVDSEIATCGVETPSEVCWASRGTLFHHTCLPSWGEPRGESMRIPSLSALLRNRFLLAFQ